MQAGVTANTMINLLQYAWERKKCQQDVKLEDLDSADDVSLLSQMVRHMQIKTERLQYCKNSRSEDQCHKDQEHENKSSQEAPSLLMTWPSRNLIASPT